ncbi:MULTISPECIES: TRAP transporter large permease [unclassified Halomonas]|uniref:TRAP transporter large permease n=1 Tax=unclassified Halomonas TaxID=2609666 RepID=UPI0007DA186C|nr:MULTISPECIES: TRAP transporter large permease [unclassified Halomonas]MBT2787371.1 TRAP transporter large permease [Halomonas sp. ISL-106]MBT2796267.1 TRAP transporter large permease [Halomonas sp. ISL-104]OAL57582.1 C4-dicarboxylate ABC transporter [Halomonas sp. ALS9]
MMLVCILFLVFLLMNVPIAFTIGIASLSFFLVEPNLPISLYVQRMVSGTQSFPLLAVPFFVLAGHIMNAAGITKRLIRFANALTGHLIGGLAHVSIVLSGLMGGVSGSANADAAMQSRILAPQMLKRGYSGGYAISVIAVSSLITATIPPSIGLILYGFVGEVSIGKLFIAGIVPGVLLTFVLMITSYIIAKKRGYDSQVNIERPSFNVVVDSFKDSFWALLFPVILIVGIRFGIFTASEGGAFAVVYALFIGAFVYRELSFSKVREVLSATVMDNAVIMLIISTAAILGYLVTYARVPHSISELIMGVTSEPALVLLLVLLFILIAGMFMEATVNTLLLTPIFLPIVQQFGVDPVHFGIIMMLIVTLGGMTPPVGVTMYTVCSLTGISIDQYLRESFPFLLSVVVLVLVLAFFPGIVMFLPDLLM